MRNKSRMSKAQRAILRVSELNKLVRALNSAGAKSGLNLRKKKSGTADPIVRPYDVGDDQV